MSKSHTFLVALVFIGALGGCQTGEGIRPTAGFYVPFEPSQLTLSEVQVFNSYPGSKIKRAFIGTKFYHSDGSISYSGAGLEGKYDHAEATIDAIEYLSPFVKDTDLILLTPPASAKNKGIPPQPIPARFQPVYGFGIRETYAFSSSSEKVGYVIGSTNGSFNFSSATHKDIGMPAEFGGFLTPLDQMTPTTCQAAMMSLLNSRPLFSKKGSNGEELQGTPYLIGVMITPERTPDFEIDSNAIAFQVQGQMTKQFQANPSLQAPSGTTKGSK